MRYDRTFEARKHVRSTAAFTLVELILVMATLGIVIAIAAPMLSNFFRGRRLESEARRFVALARYGQNRAVSDGVPMILWLDRTEGTYGLREEDGYALRDLPLQSLRVRERGGYEGLDAKEPGFRLAENLRFEVEITGRTNGRIVTIRFMPDGSIDETSLRTLQILQESRNATGNGGRATELMWITQSHDRSRYEIVDETNAWERIHPQTRMQSGIYLR